MEPPLPAIRALFLALGMNPRRSDAVTIPSAALRRVRVKDARSLSPRARTRSRPSMPAAIHVPLPSHTRLPTVQNA